MLQMPPAAPGMAESEIDTPALLLDLDAFEANLAIMRDLLAPTGVKLRAHAKAHKSSVIAWRQIAHGAIGQCVQKVSEAEALAWGGIPDILVANEIVGAGKLARLASLARIAEVALVADSESQVAAAEQAAEAARVRLRMLVEVDIGGTRCGVAPGPEAAALAQRIATSKHLRFDGLQAYHGSAQHLRRAEQRHFAIAAAAEHCRRTVDILRQQGLDCPTVTGGGTGTFLLEAASGVYNEVQAGSYAFMDADYAQNLDARGEMRSPFRQSLFVLATVMSAARAGVAVVDAGHKAVAVDSGLPLLADFPGAKYVSASDEHGKLTGESSALPRLGEKVRLIPGHCDPTVDRYDWYVGVRGGRVECLWPIAARGMMA